MEAFFDQGGPWGRQMMCGTASVQVCLDAGEDSDGPSGYRQRWQLVHAIGPVLVAAFANSPLREGKPTGWVSSRQQVWTRMDPGRTRPPRPDEDPREAWAAYALDAQVMCVPNPDSGDWSAPPGLTFRDWVRGDPVTTDPVTRGNVTARCRGTGHRGTGQWRGRRRGRAAAAAHRRRPRVPPVHAVPAGQAARALRAADDRRAAGRRVDRAARRVKRAAVRRQGGRRRPRGRRAALGRALARRRGAVGARRAARARRPGDQPGQPGHASPPPGKPWTAWPPPPRSRGPSTPSSTST